MKNKLILDTIEEFKLTENQVKILDVMISWDHYWNSYSALSDETSLTIDVLKKEMKLMASLGWVEYTRGLLNDDGEVAGSGWFVVYPFEAKLRDTLKQYKIEAPDSWKEVEAWKTIKKHTFGNDNFEVTASVNILLEIERKRAFEAGQKSREKEIVEILQSVETIAEDEQKHHFTEHCPCLRYAIWRLENPDSETMVHASSNKD